MTSVHSVLGLIWVMVMVCRAVRELGRPPPPVAARSQTRLPGRSNDQGQNSKDNISNDVFSLDKAAPHLAGPCWPPEAPTTLICRMAWVLHALGATPELDTSDPLGLRPRWPLCQRLAG